MVRRRKMALRVRETTSATGNASHTSSSRPIWLSSHATGRSTTQVGALSEAVEEAADKLGLTLRRSEGQSGARWIVMDYGSILVHIFHPEERNFYHLERLWEDGQNRVILPFDQTV